MLLKLGLVEIKIIQLLFIIKHL